MNNTIMCAVIWETCSLTFPVVLSHTDSLPTGILQSQWLGITKSLAELGEMGNHPAAASITQGTTGIKSASWLRRSSLTFRWDLQNLSTCLDLLPLLCSASCLQSPLNTQRWNGFFWVCSPVSGTAERSEAGRERAASPSSIRGRDEQGGVCTWSPYWLEGLDLVVELLYLFIFKLKTIVIVPVYFQEKKGTLKESDKAVMTAFDAIVNFCEELGWVRYFQTV